MSTTAPADLPAEPTRVVVVSAGTGNPSSTRQLSDRIAEKTLGLLERAGTPATASVIDLGPLAVDTARAASVSRAPERTRSAPSAGGTADMSRRP